MERLWTFWRAERPALPLWAPVMIGLGVQVYFLLPMEPPAWWYSLSLSVPLILWAVLWRVMRRAWILGAAILLVALGFSAAGMRAAMVAAPVLQVPVDATIEGRIVEMSRSPSGRPRVVMDEVVIFGVSDDETPRRAQITLQRKTDGEGLAPGDRVSIFAQIGPPGGPVEPGGFDYRRTAWFKSLGGIGFARGRPAKIEALGEPGLLTRLSLTLASVRAEMSAGLRDRMPGETGAIAAALTVGDRSGIPTEATEALRSSNLAHLLAISGLHMGLVTALVFGAARLALAATPVAGRRWRTKRIAAWIALAAATGYLLISGGSIATQRAYIMAAVALIAVIINRPAITLRALAVAATIILLFRPESLTHVGFQMSFAATGAIIAGLEFARARGWTEWFYGTAWWRTVLGYILALAATSLLAGLATAPFSAFHFNKMANYGLFANLAAVPVMGFWVAPAALIGAALAPLGLEHWPLQVMSWGISVILAVARFVASLDGAVRPVAAAAPAALTLIVVGGLLLCLCRSPLRALGFAPVLFGLWIWLFDDVRPEVLVAPNAALLGQMTDQGRDLDHAKAAGYVATQWLRRDGDLADQELAAERPGLTRGYAGGVAELRNGWRVMTILARRPDFVRLNEICREKTFLIIRAKTPRPEGPCLALSGDDLRAAGALSLDPVGDAVLIRNAARVAGRRYWTGL